MTGRIENTEIKKLYRLLGERTLLELIGMSGQDIWILERAGSSDYTITELAREMQMPEDLAYGVYQRVLVRLTKKMVAAAAEISGYKNTHKRYMALERENAVLRIELGLLKINRPQDFEMPAMEQMKEDLPPPKTRAELFAMKIEELPFTDGVARTMKNCGIKNVQRLMDMSEYEVVRLPGIGAGKLAHIKKVLADKGLQLTEY